MKKIILILVILMVLPTVVWSSQINWMSHDKGMRLAKQHNKKVFLHFRTDWCGYCKKMDQTTFRDAKVIEALNRDFVAIKVDGEKQKDLVRSYRVGGYPANYFLDETGKRVGGFPGYVKSEVLLFYLEYLQTDKYKTMTPKQYYESR